MQSTLPNTVKTVSQFRTISAAAIGPCSAGRERFGEQTRLSLAAIVRRSAQISNLSSTFELSDRDLGHLEQNTCRRARGLHSAAVRSRNETESNELYVQRAHGHLGQLKQPRDVSGSTCVATPAAFDLFVGVTLMRTGEAANSCARKKSVVSNRHSPDPRRQSRTRCCGCSTILPQGFDNSLARLWPILCNACATR